MQKQPSDAKSLRRPLLSVNGHLVGHYPAYTMVTYERKKYLINTSRADFYWLKYAGVAKQRGHSVFIASMSFLGVN